MTAPLSSEVPPEAVLPKAVKEAMAWLSKVEKLATQGALDEIFWCETGKCLAVIRAALALREEK